MKKKIELKSFWSEEGTIWLEVDGEESAEEYFLCNSFTYTKGFRRGETSVSRRRLSPSEYQEILRKENEYLAALEAARKREELKKEEKARRAAAYMAVSPFTFHGDTYVVTENCEILWDGNFLGFVPREVPSSEEEARKLLASAIEEALAEEIE